MSKAFIKIVELDSSEKFRLDKEIRAIVLLVENFSPDESFCHWLENLETPVVLALKTLTSERLVSAAHLCVAAQTAEIGDGSAETALKLGMINKIVSPGDVENEAMALAEKISSLAPLAIRACLKAVSEGLKMPLESGLKLEVELFAQIFSTTDMREGTSAFLEKRKPKFEGR